MQPDQTASVADIEAGYEDNGRVVVTKGLSGTETVVISGQTRLSPGTHVSTSGNGAAQG